jgi:hypothetical protein
LRCTPVRCMRDDEVAGDADVLDEPQEDPDDEKVLLEVATMVGRVHRHR